MCASFPGQDVLILFDTKANLLSFLKLFSTMFTFRECLDFNVLGTMSVMDLCKQLKKLDSFVHVSTAYAYCQLEGTEEKVYPMTVTPEQMLDVAKWLDRDSLASLKDAVFEERPNTYTFTKALAEQYIKENRQREG